MTMTKSDMATRAALLRTKQSEISNMTKPDKLQMPSRVRGANKAAPADNGATVTPLAEKNNKATNIYGDEEESTNGEAQPTAMDVDAQSGNKHTLAVEEEEDPATAA